MGSLRMAGLSIYPPALVTQTAHSGHIPCSVRRANFRLWHERHGTRFSPDVVGLICS
ncbi:MAG TPA: hypothetical protein VFU49_15565 [Ktedonobacteraceae bacterium]|nr:hypothetical protein [Ktedonobacteraceae bacterium]